MKKIIYLLAAGIIASCGGKGNTEAVDATVNGQEQSQNNSNLENNFVLTGKINNANQQSLTLEALSSKGTIKLAETNTDADGSFTLKGNIQGMGLYQLKLGTGTKIIPLTLEPNDKIHLTADAETFDRLPKLTGGRWTDAVTKYMEQFNDFANQQTALLAKKGLSEEEQIKEFMRLRQPLDKFAREEILKNPANPANIILTTSMTPAMGFENWDPNNMKALAAMADAFQKEFGDSPIASSMITQYEQISQGYKEYSQFKSEPKAADNGNTMAPEIALKNPEGKVIKLSSLRGKVVLIDFWASWCGPCRQENPNVVKVYNHYKDKGFTVYSVSLDKDAEAWKRAIKSDGLIWPNHVSDLKMWQSPMIQLYGISGIPHTVLIDQKGKIITTNLRGPALEQKLKEILK